MAKRRVDGVGNRKLDSDPGQVSPGQTPTMFLYRRETIGRDDDGNRIFDWVAFDEATVVTYDDISVDTPDEIIRTRVKVVALYPGEMLDMNGVAFTIDSDPGPATFYRVTHFEQNGQKLVMEAEAAL